MEKSLLNQGEIWGGRIVAQIFSARLAPHGPEFDAPAAQTLLQSAEQAGLSLDSSCRNGTCRFCLRQLVSGQVTYRIAWPGLSLDEKREGYILPCVAYPASDVVLVALLDETHSS